jgi:acetyl-CoA acetyltransferase
MANEKSVAVLGAGMHPWGKWGRNFVEYGLAAAGDALTESGVDWTDIQYVAGADTIRNGYPGFIAGATFAQALGWTGARVSSAYAACASGAQAINNARAQILAGLCDVALVVGADTTPKGFFKPVGATARTTRTGCASTSWGPPTPHTSPCTPAVGWSCSGLPRPTLLRSR